MKIVTVLGTRPEIIRLSLLMRKLDELSEEHTVVHTGQNYVRSLSGQFFQELRLREPDVVLSRQQQSLGGQLAIMFGELERILLEKRPDKMLVLGDTNSALSAVLAERMGIPVAHMEAGNRCFDNAVPEEKNRRVIDAVSTINMPYTERSKQNLLREGVPVNRIVVSGNPIYEVLRHYDPQIDASGILGTLSLVPGRYFLATIHRAENVDDPDRLHGILSGLQLVAERLDGRMICSLHPRTASRLAGSPHKYPRIEYYEPFGFFDFVRLERHARCVLTDSGTVQEECCIFRVPTVTVRQSTERPETVDCGSNIVSGLEPERMLLAVRTMLACPRDWACPAGYLDTDVSSRVAKVLAGRLPANG